MKTSTKTRFLILALVLSANSFAQTTFQKSYGNIGALQPSIVPKANGFLLLGNEQDDSTSGNILCAFVNKNGKLQWSKTYGSQYFDGYPVGLSTSDGNIVLATESYIGNEYHGAIILKTDANGNVIWSKRITSTRSADIKPTCLLEDADGNYVMVSTFPISQYAQIVKISSSGNLIWQRLIRFDLQLPDFIEARTITETSTRDIVVSVELVHAENNGRKAGILRLNSNGKPLSFKTICSNTCNSWEAIYVKNLSEKGSNLFMLSKYYDANLVAHFCWFNMNNQATQTTATLAANSLFTLQHFVNNGAIYHKPNATVDGNFFDNTGSIYNVGVTNLFLNKYDNKGRICPIFSTPPIDSTTTPFTFYLTDAPISQVTDTVKITNETLTVASVNYQQNICAGAASLIAAQQSDAISNAVVKNTVSASTVFPNPAKNFVTVKSGSISAIKITDLSGKTQKLFEYKTPLTAVNINLSGIVPGTYFVSILDGSKWTTQKLVVAQ